MKVREYSKYINTSLKNKLERQMTKRKETQESKTASFH